MNRISIIFVLLMMTLVSNISTVHSQSKVGTSAAPFLGIAVGPRAIGLGGAFVAIASDASALYWNPGGIARLGRSEVMLSHTAWLVNTKFDWAGAVVRLTETDALGISFTQLDYGEEKVTNENYQDGTGEMWNAVDMAIGLSYARGLTDRFSIGGTAKYIQQRVWNESASSLGVDVGLIYNTGFNNLNIGMSISNFGSDMRLDGKDLYRPIDLDPTSNGTNKTIVARLKTDDWPLPLFFRAGVSIEPYKTEDFRFTVAADALRPSDNAEVLNTGAEFSYREVLFFRAGYKALGMAESQEGLTLGVGARYELAAMTEIGVDYSYQDFGFFGGIQTFAVAVTF